MPHISSANVACGAHAGDPAVMRATFALAVKHGVSCGAHPGFADLAGFGRREIPVTPTEAGDLILWQIGALAAIAKSDGIALTHVKTHGALYNMAARDRRLADALAAAVASFDQSLVFFGLAGSVMIDAGRSAGLRGRGRRLRRSFVRTRRDPHTAVAGRGRDQGCRHRRRTSAPDGPRRTRADAHRRTDIPLRVDTICVHGDTPGAAALAAALRQGLERGGIPVSAARKHA